MSNHPSQLPVAKPVLGESEVEAVRRVILSGWVSQGPEVAAFERDFCDFTGAPFATAVSNCTTALHLALLAVGVGAGDEVVTVSHSFIATANAIRYCGASPVFVDIEAAGFNMDPVLLERAITPKSKAILCVHQLGMPCDLQRILEIGRRHGVPVIEDAACAIGSEVLWNGQWEKIGKPHGDIACFSFHPRKVVTTGDGGMLTTANPEYDRKFKLWRQHSMSVSDAVRHGSKQVIYETYPEVGFNYRMTDVQAAIGRVQLKRLPEIVAGRRRLAALYGELLAGIEGLALPVEPAGSRSNWQSYCVVLGPDCDQRAFMQVLLDNGISTRRGVMNTHLEEAYADHRSRRFPRGVAAQSCGVILPMFSGMNDADVRRVADCVREVLAPVHAALAAVG